MVVDGTLVPREGTPAHRILKRKVKEWKEWKGQGLHKKMSDSPGVAGGEEKVERWRGVLELGGNRW